MSQLARVVFALLVAATFGAFFVAQRLKSAESVAEYTKLTRVFSPNGDGRRDVARITLQGQGGRRADGHGRQPRRRPGAPPRVGHRRQPGPRRDRRLGRQDRRRHTRTRRPLPPAARPPAHRPHGHDRGLVRRRHARPRRPSCSRCRRRSPAPCPAPSRSAPAASAAAARRASASCAPTSIPSRRSRASRAARAAGCGVWDGQVDGAPAPPGIYMVVVRVRDRAGNVGTAPAVLPPIPGQVRGKPGITVRQITAQPPVAPVRAGERVQFFVDSRRRAYRWNVRRVGASRPIKKGRGAPGKTLSLRAPRGISGAYLLQVRSGRSQRPRAVPRAGAGAREAARRRRPRCRGWASTRSTTTATGCRTRSRPAAR